LVATSNANEPAPVFVRIACFQSALDYHRTLPKLFTGAYVGTVSDIDWFKRETGVKTMLNLKTDDDMRYFKLD
jgi:hypothetical protein